VYSVRGQDFIRVLVADDDEHVLDCYLEAFCDDEPTNRMRALDELAAELFDPDQDIADQPKFDIVACRQGDEAIRKAKAASEKGKPFDVVILDVRMPPGIDGVEAGSKIRELDPDVEMSLSPVSPTFRSRSCSDACRRQCGCTISTNRFHSPSSRRMSRRWFAPTDRNRHVRSTTKIDESCARRRR